MTKDFLFHIAPDPTGSQCKCCPAPSEFLTAFYYERDAAGFFTKSDMNSLCAICIVPYVLQTLKTNGASLIAIESGFSKLSAAVDAPPGSKLLQ
jgi:hypothetical protein